MIKKINRRQFLQGTGLATGTLVLGIQFSPLLAKHHETSVFNPDVFVSMDDPSREHRGSCENPGPGPWNPVPQGIGEE